MLSSPCRTSASRLKSSGYVSAAISWKRSHNQPENENHGVFWVGRDLKAMPELVGLTDDPGVKRELKEIQTTTKKGKDSFHQCLL